MIKLKLKIIMFFTLLGVIRTFAFDKNTLYSSFYLETLTIEPCYIAEVDSMTAQALESASNYDYDKAVGYFRERGKMVDSIYTHNHIFSSKNSQYLALCLKEKCLRERFQKDSSILSPILQEADSLYSDYLYGCSSYYGETSERLISVH